MTCTNCRRELPPLARFCDRCGMQILPSSETGAPPAEPLSDSFARSEERWAQESDTKPLPSIGRAWDAPSSEAPPPQRGGLAAPPAPVLGQAPKRDDPSREDGSAEAAHAPPAGDNPDASPPISSGEPSFRGPLRDAPPWHRREPLRPRNWGPVLSLRQAVGFVLISLVPLVGFIAMCLWAFGNSRHPSRQNMARAVLIIWLVLLAVLIVAVVTALLLMSYFNYTLRFDPNFWQYFQ